MPISAELAAWASRVTFDDLPADVVRSTKLRVLDVIGLSLAGAETPFGRSVRQAAVALGSGGHCRIFGTGDSVNVGMAAFANGAFSQALEYDDTHNESIVHMSSPSVSAALAIADTTRVSGRDLITAIAVGNEISCRAGAREKRGDDAALRRPSWMQKLCLRAVDPALEDARGEAAADAGRARHLPGGQAE